MSNKLCSESGCTKQARNRGLCSGHQSALYRAAKKAGVKYATLRPGNSEEHKRRVSEVAERKRELRKQDIVPRINELLKRPWRGLSA